MPPLTVADAAIAIGGDLAGFDRSLDKAAAKTTGLGERLKGAFSPGKVFGAVAGATIGIMLSGAEKLDAATRRLQADTGMTAEEAERASHALAGMYRDNLQGFDAIGAAMAAVHNDLGLVGDDADRTTAKFLKFATATGQDAAGAVTAFDDILDAWNLTAEDAGGLMDKLIVSHQKFGGAIAASQAALAAMAPAMTAGNMSIDDGIALLNLFNAAGIEASKAPTMLARAVKQLKPGQNINDLIAQISSIEDPTLRGQKAMEIFGVRGGVGMATALRPGMGALSDYAISADDAADATNNAADAIESGWGAKFRQIMKWAGGALAEFGSNFGPLLMVAAAFGPKFTMAIASGLGGLASMILPRIVGAITAAIPGAAVAGEAIGSAVSGGIAAGIAAGGMLVRGAIGILLNPLVVGGAIAAGVGAAIGYAIVSPEVDRAKRELTEKTAAWVTTATTDALMQSRAGVAAQMERVPTLLGWDLFGGKAAIQDSLDQIDAELQKRSQQIADGIAGVFKGGTKVASTIESTFADLNRILKEQTDRARVIGVRAFVDFGKAIEEQRAALEQGPGFDKWDLRELPIKIREAKRDVRRAQHELEQARTKEQKDEAKLRLLEAQRQLEGLVTDLGKQKTAFKLAGMGLGNAFGTGLNAAFERWRRKIYNFPVPTIHVSGEGAVIGGGGHAHRQYGGLVMANVPYWVGEERRPELFVPETSGRIIPSDRLAGGGNTYNVNVTGLIRARDPLEIATQLRRLAEFGVLTPKRVPA